MENTPHRCREPSRWCPRARPGYLYRTGYPLGCLKGPRPPRWFCRHYSIRPAQALRRPGTGHRCFCGGFRDAGSGGGTWSGPGPGGKPDTELMKQAALLLAGKHDFKKFSTVKKNKSTEKEILNIDIYEDLEEIQITLEATDFLHNMPRMILSTLLDIGLGIRRKEEIDEILSPTSSTVASAPCDPKGLYLQEVVYDR